MSFKWRFLQVALLSRRSEADARPGQALSGSVRLFGRDDGDADSTGLLSDPGRLAGRAAPDLLPVLRRTEGGRERGRREGGEERVGASERARE